MESATKSLDSLERLLPKKKKNAAAKGDDKEEEEEEEGSDDDDDDNNNNNHADETENSIVEISGDDDESTEKQLRALQLSDSRREDVRRIRVKALMRRAKGRVEQGGWGNLTGAEEGMYT